MNLLTKYTVITVVVNDLKNACIKTWSIQWCLVMVCPVFSAGDQAVPDHVQPTQQAVGTEQQPFPLHTGWQRHLWQVRCWGPTPPPAGEAHIPAEDQHTWVTLHTHKQTWTWTQTCIKKKSIPKDPSFLYLGSNPLAPYMDQYLQCDHKEVCIIQNKATRSLTSFPGTLISHWRPGPGCSKFVWLVLFITGTPNLCCWCYLSMGWKW